MAARASPEGTRPPSAAPDRLIPELDGVRGIAILLVLFFHFGHRPEAVPRWMTGPFALGWSGVDLFFALSGFLITGILLDTRNAPNQLRSFYARRVLRIFPLYLLSLVLCFAVASPLASGVPGAPPAEGGLQAWYWLHVSNWQSAFGREVGWLTHFWSLAVEEQFYLVWPWLVRALPVRHLGKACLGLLALGLLLRVGCLPWTRTYPDLLVRLTPFRIDTLAAGGLAACLVRDPSIQVRLTALLGPVAAAAGLAFGCLLAFTGSSRANGPWMSTLGFSLLAVLSSCLVLAGRLGSGGPAPLARLLRWPLLRTFGKVSYGIYVIHFPLSLWLGPFVLSLAQGRSPALQGILWALLRPAGAVLSLLLAQVSWHLFERRFLALKGRFQPGPPPEEAAGA